jgi:hypothetical protein
MQENKNYLPEGLIYPKESFEEFYHRFKTVREMTEDPYWSDVFSIYYELEDDELDIPIGEKTSDLDAFSAEEQIEEVIKCARNFFYWCHRYVKILHPKFGTIPFIPYKYQRRVIKEYESKRFNMISKFRQGGITTIAVLWGLWKCAFQKDQQIYFLSKTDREALAAADIARRAMDNFPYWMFDKNESDITKHEKKFNDVGSKLCFYTPEAARGKSATCIIVDEAAFIENMDEHWKAMYPVIATGGHIQIISTVNGIGNWYEETYREAEAGRNFFNIINLDYWEHPAYSNPDWAKEMKANLGEKGWQQEVLRDFLGSGETYVSSNVISHLDRLVRQNFPTRTAFDKWTNEQQKKNNLPNGALWVWKEPMDGHEYIIGVDSSEGVGEDGDNSCFEIIDAISLEQVAEFYSNLVPPHIYAQIINQIGIYYNSATVVVENNAIGGAVLNCLTNDLGYENIFYEHKKGSANKPGIKISSSNRPLLLESMQHRLVNGTAKINSSRFISELKTFIYSPQKKRAEAIKGKHDDAIMALCLALYIRDESVRGIPLGSESEDILKIIKNNSYDEIKREILEGGIDDWISKEETKEFSIDQFDFEIKRQGDKILKEFGW